MEMSKTEAFRKQHGEMVQIVKEISKYLNPDAAHKNATELSKLLSALAGKLKMHLVMEDDGLYPTLITHTDPNVRNLAAQFRAEMGNLKPVVEGYTKKWMLPKTIQDNPTDFIKETKNLFDALAKRIERENNELYTMIDKIAA